MKILTAFIFTLLLVSCSTVQTNEQVTADKTKKEKSEKNYRWSASERNMIEK